MSELGETLGQLIRDKEDMKQSLSPHGGTPSILVFPTEQINFKIVNFVVTQTILSSSNSFIVGHSQNGIVGLATGMGGGQVVVGSDGGSATSDLIRRRYEWRKKSELDSGTYDPNISTEDGRLRLK